MARSMGAVVLQVQHNFIHRRTARTQETFHLIQQHIDRNKKLLGIDDVEQQISMTCKVLGNTMRLAWVGAFSKRVVEIHQHLAAEPPAQTGARL